jgi:ATP-dependent DNA helicase RecG
MTDGLAELVRLLRADGTDSRRVEAKAAEGGLPRSVRETLSAFSNDTGGTLVLGLDERTGFRPVAALEAARLRDGLDAMCADEMYPPVRATIDILEFEGRSLVVAEVPELDPAHKPCYVKSKGEFSGSYTRGGDGDRRMTEYEISLLHANRGQPRDDHEAVDGAAVSDLDARAVQRLLDRLREREQRVFAGIDDEQALRRVGVLVERPDGSVAPSLAGLLAVGAYPQEFFPQLNVTFVVIPATSKDAIPPDGPRFLDNRTINGSVPVMVDETVRSIIRNMSTRGQVSGVGRVDSYDYPVEALREAITNALMHRDYGPYARGTQVQVEMFADRLLVRSPGGLFGAVTEDDLGQEGVSSSRNAYLARLLQDVTLPGSDRVVCENRGTGIPAMLNALRRVGMTTPVFDSRLTRFLVTFPKHALLVAEVHAWLETLGQDGLTDAQCMALALMREGRVITNATLRQLGLDRREATAALSDLVARGLAVAFDGRRYAKYSLRPTSSGGDGQLPLPLSGPEAGTAVGTTDDSDRPAGRRNREAEVDALFEDGRSLRTPDVVAATGLGPAMALRYLSRLVAQGRLVATGPERSRHRAYRRPGSGEGQA